MRYREQLDIILMRDKGPRRAYKMRWSSFIIGIAFFAAMPVCCVLLAWGCVHLWERNRMLEESVERFEADARAAAERAEKLALYQELVDGASAPARELILRRLAGPPKPLPAQGEEALPEVLEEGPGHEDFGALDNGAINVENVQARRTSGNSLRISLDLRNPDTDKILGGLISAALITADGENLPLSFTPHDAGAFRIKRFKRASLLSRPGQHINLADGRVVIEIKDTAGTPIFRNIYAIQR